MRNTITAILIASTTLSSGLVNAQSAHSHLRNFNTYRGHSVRHLPTARFTRSALASKTTATDVRLIAMVELQHDGAAYVQGDSSTLTYSGTKGGIFDPLWMSWNWRADLANVYSYDTATGSYGPATGKTMISYDVNGNIANYTEQEWNSSTSAWDNTYMTVSTYDVANNLVKQLDYQWNTATSLWDSAYKSTYTYTSTNKVASFTQEQWNSGSSMWENSSREIYTWNPSDNVICDSVQFWSGSAWMDVFKINYTYDGSGNRTTELNLSWTGSSWDTTGKVVHTGFVANHQPQSSVFMTWNSATSAFENYNRDNYTYNTYGKPVYYFNENWDNATAAWTVDTFATATRYHYQTYSTSTTGVEQLADNGVEAMIFPVPATNSLSIEATWAEAQPFTASITDMCGRTFSTWTMPAGKQYRETISVSDLPPGNYVLALRGKQGSISKQFSVVK